MGIYPLVNFHIAMENGPVEIVDFPMKSMVDLSMAKCDSSPEGKSHASKDDLMEYKMVFHGILWWYTGIYY